MYEQLFVIWQEIWATSSVFCRDPNVSIDSPLFSTLDVPEFTSFDNNIGLSTNDRILERGASREVRAFCSCRVLSCEHPVVYADKIQTSRMANAKWRPSQYEMMEPCCPSPLLRVHDPSHMSLFPMRC